MDRTPVRTPTARMSALSRAILQYLEVNGPSQASEIRVAVVQDQHRAELVDSYLVNLRGLGYVVRFNEDQRGRVWKLAPASKAAGVDGMVRQEAAQKPGQADASVPASVPAPAWKGEIVAPRRMDVMTSEPYRTAPVVLRPGSRDYASLPSLHMGKRCAPGSWLS